MRKILSAASWGLAVLLILTAAACGSATQPPADVEVDSKPVAEEMAGFDKHTYTAFESYARAAEDAQRWNPNARLVQISPTRITEGNLGLPVGGPVGWFFMFMEEGSPLELYVEIVDGAVFGRSEAQPIRIDAAPYELEPIDPESGLLDSDEALAVYWNDGGKELYVSNPEINLDFRLIHIRGQEHPVWTIYDTANLVSPLYHVDAVTGEETEDPFASIP